MKKRYTAERWRKYWADKACPLHRVATEEHYSQYGAELRVLWHGARIGKVLEIGCGDGSLYAHLGFDVCHYRGVDFSPRMLERFRARHPGVDLIQEEGATYADDQRYDLIFSNGVLQYFSEDMLGSHLAAARLMVAEKGRLVLGSIPWKALRREFEGGVFASGAEWHGWRWLKTQVGNAIRGDRMGRWYGFEDVATAGRRHGFSCLFFGSMLYPYRFHVVLSLQ